MLEKLLAALDLPADTVAEPAAGGASGAAWRIESDGRSYVLRHSSPAALTDARLAAMEAARRAGLPAPELAGRATTEVGDAVLLAWLPGTNLLDLLVRSPADAHDWGRRMGELQRRLHQIPAPDAVPNVLRHEGRPFAAGRDVPGVPTGDRLLHLDWHPLNLLADPGSVEISGIVDWDNARAGHPLLDLARTQAILTREPSLSLLSPTTRATLAPLLDGWIEGYGPLARALPASCQLWAGRVMLADLAPRYRERPGELDALRAWTEELARNAPC